ncbi:glycosyltransferase family 2 protein [Pedobacter heparinus]|uniref:Glycosyl transferase family 2 n=1 Tax=Pedobacter heparinus (strain ATCC 13125 / DSM 2366 / CIP 104194 / JCM 7457 / NBRC 12017 / NCIMB 9290 / NRRL B-14731 / HIM 762-3) TaxID=485917 RepID=C6XW98_PEDHD|nr:glycosyltransferase family 2 protein [Pedobacter heparinus]ACU04177.1 glycosyl transferase family 2 [Pedobacter heparinus DSM 2366]
MTQQNYFKNVTLLITHYNRSKSLERLLKSFQELNCVFEDVVISDDGSKQEHLVYITELKNKYNFRLITTPKNKGLGNNINKGQDNVTTPYTLYIQEDFIPKPNFPEHFRDGLNIMEEDKQWDMISFYAYEFYPYSRPYKLGFSEKQFKMAPWFTNNLKFYLYSDHPHLRKSSFLQKFGRYAEGLNVDKTEMLMSLSFIKNKGKALFFDDHYGLLTQDNEQHESSTASYRKSWKNKDATYMKLGKWAYAKIKFVKLNVKLFTTRKHPG